VGRRKLPRELETCGVISSASMCGVAGLGLSQRGEVNVRGWWENQNKSFGGGGGGGGGWVWGWGGGGVGGGGVGGGCSDQRNKYDMRKGEKRGLTSSYFPRPR